MDIKDMLGNLIFLGIVSSIESTSLATVRVTRQDKDNKVSASFRVLQQGTHGAKSFWMPQVGDQVVCLRLPNFSGKGTGEGFVLGSVYSTADPSAESNPKARSFTAADGSQVKYDGEGNISVHAAGNYTVTAASIYLN